MPKVKKPTAQSLKRSQRQGELHLMASFLFREIVPLRNRLDELEHLQEIVWQMQKELQ